MKTFRQLAGRLVTRGGIAFMQVLALLPLSVTRGLGVLSKNKLKQPNTMTLAARLSMQIRYLLLTVSCERLPHGKGYFLKIWAAVEGLGPSDSGKPRADLLQGVTQINRAIEAIVLSQPGQYLWGYARYKTPRKEASL